MLEVVSTSQFKKDIKKIKKRHKEFEKLKKIIELLSERRQLPIKNKDHALTGNYRIYRECHIEPDWILIYKITRFELILFRTGTHSDLF